MDKPSSSRQGWRQPQLPGKWREQDPQAGFCEGVWSSKHFTLFMEYLGIIIILRAELDPQFCFLDDLQGRKKLVGKSGSRPRAKRGRKPHSKSLCTGLQLVSLGAVYHLWVKAELLWQSTLWIFLNTDRSLRFLTLPPWKKCGAIKSAVTFYQRYTFLKWKVQLPGHFNINNDNEIVILPKGFTQTWCSCKCCLLEWNCIFPPASRTFDFYTVLGERFVAGFLSNSESTAEKKGKESHSRRCCSS